MWIICYCYEFIDVFLFNKFNFFFKVILDYKILILFLVKKDEEDFFFGGRGVFVEFCFICNVVRVCVLVM